MQMFVQEEDEKERLSQANEASEDDGTEHAEAVEDSLLGLSIEEVFFFPEILYCLFFWIYDLIQITIKNGCNQR